jgi:hypothetical protein
MSKAETDTAGALLLIGWLLMTVGLAFIFGWAFALVVLAIGIVLLGLGMIY